jgi:hypothetical protein
MKKNVVRNVLLVSIIILVIAALVLIGLLYIKKNKKPVYLDDIKVSSLITKLNDNLKSSKIEYFASEENLLKEDDSYWYGLHEDIVLHLLPLKYTGEVDKDIVLESGIFYDKDSKNSELASKYIVNLIKSNALELTDEEIDEIIKQAKEIGKDNINSKNGKGYSSNGLIITYWTNEDNYHISIEREREVLDEKNN